MVAQMTMVQRPGRRRGGPAAREDTDRGRGLMVVGALTDSYDVESSDSGTTVTMRKRLEVAGTAERDAIAS